MTLLSCVILKSLFTLKQNPINFAINKVIANIVTDANAILIIGDISRTNAHTALAALANIAIKIKYMLILLFPPATFPLINFPEYSIPTIMVATLNDALRTPFHKNLSNSALPEISNTLGIIIPAISVIIIAWIDLEGFFDIKTPFFYYFISIYIAFTKGIELVENVDYVVNKNPDEEEGDLAILLSESKVKMNCLAIKLNTPLQIFESIKKDNNENQNFDELIKSADFPEDYDPFDDEMLDMIP